jgi:hypothetical protein
MGGSVLDTRTMTENEEEFIERMTKLWAGVAEAHRETVAYWAPEPPPPTIAFAEIGHRIVGDLRTIPPDLRREIFTLMEQAMQSGDEPLGTSVATGMIEAMVGTAARLGMWDEVRRQFGPASRFHAEAWYGDA